MKKYNFEIHQEIKVPIKWDRNPVKLTKIRSNNSNPKFSSSDEDEDGEIDLIEWTEEFDIDKSRNDIDKSIVLDTNKYNNILNLMTQDEYSNLNTFKLGEMTVKIKKNNGEFIIFSNEDGIDNIRFLGVISADNNVILL